MENALYSDIYNDVPTITEESSAGSASMFPPATMAYEDFLRLTKKLKKKNKKLKEKDKKRKKKEKKRKKKQAKQLKKMCKRIKELEKAYECHISKSVPYDRFSWLKEIVVDCAPKVLDFLSVKEASKNYKAHTAKYIEVPKGQYTVRDTEVCPVARLTDRSNKRS